MVVSGPHTLHLVAVNFYTTDGTTVLTNAWDYSLL